MQHIQEVWDRFKIVILSCSSGWIERGLHTKEWKAPLCYEKFSVGVFGLCTIAAHPGIGPIRRQLCAFRNVWAPGVCLDRAIGLPDDFKLTVGLNLTDHDRLAQMVVGIHDYVIAT